MSPARAENASAVPEPETPVARRPRAWSPLVGLALIAALAAGLRLHHLGAQSLWVDELWSLIGSTGRFEWQARPPTGIFLDRAPAARTTLAGAPSGWTVWGAPTGNHYPPLYFLLLRLWREAFGDGEAMLRLPSAVASIAAIILLFDTVRLLHGPVSALWAALLMAIAPIQVLYAQEARGYALALALVLAACRLVVGIGRSGASGWRLAGLGASVLAAVLTHYYALGALGGIALYVAIRFRGVRRRRALLAFAGSAALFLAAQGPFFFSQDVSRVWESPFRESVAGHVERTLARTASVPWLHLTATRRFVMKTAPWAVLIYGVPLLMVRRRPDLMLWLLWAAGGIGIVAAHDLLVTARQLTLVRLTFMASPATYALLSATVAASRAPWRHLVPVGAALAAAVTLPAVYHPAKAPWRVLGAAVHREVAASHPIVLFAGSENPDELFLYLSHYAPLEGRPVVVVKPPVDPALAARLQHAGRFWLLSADPAALRWASTLGHIDRVIRVRGLPSLSSIRTAVGVGG